MEYSLYEIFFDGSVHFGKETLDDGEFILHADTFFSALCLEALHMGGSSMMEELVDIAKKGDIVFSDLLPYMGTDYYVPKPYIYIEPKRKGDSAMKKQYKKMEYIPIDLLDAYLDGDFPEERIGALKKLGAFSMRTLAAVRSKEKTEPYRVRTFQFADECGLYFILGSETKAAKELLNDLVEGLSYSGLGGERTSGLGRFDYFSKKVPENFVRRLTLEKDTKMLLSVALPRKDELENALPDAEYQLLRRGGFVYSDTYAKGHRRKKDLYVFQPGSCFKHCFEGDIYDVSAGGAHPVYRYAKPLFMGVK